MNSHDDDLTVEVALTATERGVEATLRRVEALDTAAARLRATLKKLEADTAHVFSAALANAPKTGAAAMFSASEFGGGQVSYSQLRDVLNGGGRPAVEQVAPQIAPHLDAILKTRAQITAAVHAAGAARNEAARAGVPVEQQPAAIATLTQADKRADRDEKGYRAAEAQAKKTNRADERRAAKDQEKQEQQTLRDEQRYRQAEAQARKRDLADEARDKKSIRALDEKAARAREREAARYQPFSQRLAGSVFSARTLSGIGALSTGDAGPLGRTLAYAFVTSLAQTPINALKPAAGAVAAELGAGAAGEEGAAAGAAGAGLGAAGTAAPTLTTLLTGLLAGPLGIAVGLAATAALGGIIGNAMQSNARADQVSMLGNVAGVDLNRPSAEEAAILTQGNRFFYSPDETRNAANQLGNAGVNGNDLPKVMADVMAFSRRTGIDLPTASGLGGIVAAQNRANGKTNGVDDQVSTVFQTIEDAARSAGIPVTRLATAVKTLAQSSGGAGLTVGAINGMATVQSMLGPTGTTADAGQLMAPAMTATGTQALQIAGMLGVSADQLYAMQQNNPAALIDRISTFAKRAAGGRSGMQGVDVAESVLQSSGMLNFAGIDPKHQYAFVHDLLTQGPKAAEQREQQRLRNQQQLQSGGAYRDSGADIAKQLTPLAEQWKRHVEYMQAQLANAGNNVQGFGNTVASAAEALAAAMKGVQSPSNTPGKPLGADLGIDPAKKGQPGPNGEKGGAWHLIAGAPDDVGPRSAYFQQAYNPATYGYQSDPAYAWQQGRDAMDVLRDPKGNPISVAVPNTRGQTDQAGTQVLKDYVYASQKFGVPLATLLAIGAKESDFHGNAASPDGGMGIAQLTPSTGIIQTLTQTKGSPFYGAKFAPHGGGKPGTIDPFNVAQATEAQAWYLKHMEGQYGGLYDAVQHYNGSGPAAQAYANAVMQSAQQVDLNLKLQLTGSDGRPMGTAQTKARVDLARRPVGHTTHGPAPKHLQAHAAPPGRGG